MTQPRAQLVPPGTAGVYHCVQRCVRRAFLCGVDGLTGHNFEHRKTWVEERLKLLSECFAVSIHAYAVMSNHLHLVVQLVPEAVAGWADEEVAARWIRLFPPREDSEAALRSKMEGLVANTERIQLVRSRLSNLSWLMRCLAEPIARRANRDDGCTGRFWEGRFKAQRLCDERALLAAMAYVDLNPVRAGIAQNLENSAHTSVSTRIQKANSADQAPNAPVGPILGVWQPPLGITTAEYLHLLDWTGRQLAPGKRGRITGPAPDCLQKIDNRDDRWMTRVRAIGNGYWRVVGSAEDLIELARQIGQRWLKGLRLAEQLG